MKQAGMDSHEKQTLCEFFFEISCEEIPPHVQTLLEKRWEEEINGWLIKYGIEKNGLKIFSTPRRVFLSINFPDTFTMLVSDKRGPRADAPQNVIDAFLNSNSASIENCYKINERGAEFLFLKTPAKVVNTKAVLSDLCEILTKISGPKMMRWGNGQIPWFRPINAITAVFGDDVIDFVFDPNGVCIRSGSFNDNVNCESYLTYLRKNGIEPDREKRREFILEGMSKYDVECFEKDIASGGLIEEVVGLIERPKVLIGSFDKKFLTMPEEILIALMRKHQRYFALKCENLVESTDNNQENTKNKYDSNCDSFALKCENSIENTDNNQENTENEDDSKYDSFALKCENSIESTDNNQANTKNKYDSNCDSFALKCENSIENAGNNQANTENEDDSNCDSFAVKCENSIENADNNQANTENEDDSNCDSFALKHSSIENRFAFVSNNPNGDDCEIISGNESVLRARLFDADFFWNNDVSTKLDAFFEKLKKKTFYNNLGTIYDKMCRMKSVSKIFNDEILSEAVFLSKIDLVMQTVEELPELQGLMSYRYVQANNFDKQICDALENSALDLNRDKTKKFLLSILDCADTLVGFFAIGLCPTGSKDPLGLRRNSLVLLRNLLLIETKFDLWEISQLIYAEYLANGAKLSLNFDDTKSLLLAFLTERIKFIAINEIGVEQQYVEAVIDGITRVFGTINDFKKVIEISSELQKFSQMNSARMVFNALKRVFNLLKSEEKRDNVIFEIDVNQSIFSTEYEKVLFDKLVELGSCKCYKKKLEILSAEIDVLSDFLDNVTVNDQNQSVRTNRLKILSYVRRNFVADFSVIC